MSDVPPGNGMVLDRFYLRRLWRFARLSHRLDAASDPDLRRLAGHATLAAYRDCLAVGLEREARALLERTATHRQVTA